MTAGLAQVVRRPAWPPLSVGAHAGETTPSAGHAGRLACRCDRIQTTLPATAITGYQVTTTASTDSDHRPVLAGFGLTRAAPGPGSPS